MAKYNMVGGDAYNIAVSIKQGVTNITPDIASGVKIKIGDIEGEYPNGEVFFSGGVWQFPITQEQSRRLAKMENGVLFEVQAKIGNNIVGSVPKPVNVSDTIITEDWEG